MRVVILGAGGYGRLVQDILRCDPTVSVEGFLDPSAALHGTSVNGKMVLGSDTLLPDLLRQGVAGAFAAIGDNHIRAKLFETLDAIGFRLPNAVHPSVILGYGVQLGRGVVLMPSVVVNANARIGDNVVVNTAATIDHDDILENHSHIWPGANLAGNVRIGEYSYVGTGAVVIPGMTIGANSIVGAGAAVTTNIPDNVVAVGVPARQIKSHYAVAHGGSRS